MTFSSGMRNISAGAVIAVSFFPAAVAVPVIVGMLFQQILASLNGHFLDRYFNRRVSKHEPAVSQ
jgi:bile acid:Na+ symporter, BASS family